MHKVFFATFAAAGLLGGAASASAQVGVSIGIHEPGVYGRIELGDAPPAPALVAPQPVIIAPPRERFERRPIYLYVPPYEQREWGRYCGRYAACGQPVYFVREDWVRERYVHEHPEWVQRHGDRGEHRGWRDDRGGPGRDHGHRD